MFIITTLLAILGLIATDIFAPSLPAIAQVFHQSLNHTQLTISLFLLGFAFSQLIYGPISDKVGRKPPLIIGVILFTAGSLLCVLAPSFSLFCLGRIIQGIAVGSGLSLARVILRDCYHGTELAIKTSQMAIFVSLTPAIAPYIGGLLQEFFGYKAVFLFLFAYGLLLLVLLNTCFKETIKQKEKNLNLSLVLFHYKQLLTNYSFMRYVLVAGFAFSSIILYANVIPFIIQNQLHLSAKQNGEVLLFAALGLSLSSFISNRLVHKISSKKLIQVGLSILTLSGLMLIATEYLFSASLSTLMPLIFLITIACGFIFPNAVAVAFSQINVNIGIAGAIYGFVQIFTSGLINFLLNAIPEQGQALLGGFYVALGILGLALCLDIFALEIGAGNEA
ncbi:MAG: ydhC 2 [Gammaproteobacteria bacterium]|nr:ydhC 2 [Gammaproteobacteria bacterium]